MPTYKIFDSLQFWTRNNMVLNVPLLDHSDFFKKRQTIASSKDTWKTCTIPEKSKSPQIQDGRVTVEMQSDRSLRKKKLRQLQLTVCLWNKINLYLDSLGPREMRKCTWDILYQGPLQQSSGQSTLFFQVLDGYFINSVI